ncbi:MAG: RNA polymerase sigma factor [Ruminococcaceae bacterium]|nr:RNA polymerase sigma factor [Oscillospiraceae bacterium]
MEDRGAELYRRYLEGEKAAFDELVCLYRQPLIFFLNRYVRNVSSAEDIAADVFVELLVHRHRYNFRSSMKTYLFMIGRSRALNFQKRQKRLQPFPEQQEPSTDEELLADRIIRDDLHRALHRALNAIPEDYRVALHLVYFEELSYRDAGRVMKKNEKQMTNLLYRGKKAVKAVLEKEGYSL